MIHSPIENPIALSIGPIAIHWYGILIAIGVATGLWVATHTAKQRNLNEGIIQDMLLIVGFMAIIGARMYYVIFNWSRYATNMPEMFAIWHGGLAIHGAIIGGVIGFCIYAYRKKLNSVWSYLDCMILGLLTGQIIGRWGNFINQEAFGKPTSLPWGIYIDPAHRPIEFATSEAFHPTFLYESVWNIALFIVLWQLNKRGTLRSGQTVALYLIVYSVGRFWIESLRTDSLMLGPLRAAQVISGIMISIGVILYLRFRAQRTTADQIV